MVKPGDRRAAPIKEVVALPEGDGYYPVKGILSDNSGCHPTPVRMSRWLADAYAY